MKKRKADKKKIIKFAIIAGILTLVAALCVGLIVYYEGCDGKYDKNYEYDGHSLLGRWVDENMDESSYDVYDFVDESHVILTTNYYGIEIDRLEATYKVEDGNKISMHSEAFGYEYIRFSITKKGELVLKVLDDLNNPSEDERVMVKRDLGYNTSNAAILGTWRSNDDASVSFTFKGDYTGTSTVSSDTLGTLEYQLKYSLKGNTLYFILTYSIGMGDTVEICEYKIEGSTLTMYGKNGEELKFTKES